ncbi:DsbA family protein [Kitasatospora sp. NE20-6]|uniref:DsbA family protein n=1 Tax=Kitasatospora sp. NE20-6 TaxID=2859066 RepID=UPI0038B2B27D
MPGSSGPGAAPDAGEALEVVEYTDPLCPWAWGSEPALRRLRRALAGRARHRRVFGLLFEDEDDPAPDPAAETAWYAARLAGIAAHTGAPRAAELRWVAASSAPASLAAAAAELQGEQVAERVLRRLRETVFVLGEPADTPARVRAALHGVPGLDLDRLCADADGPAARARIARDRAETRRPVPEVVGLRADGPHPGAAKETEDGHRYALPTLVFHGPAGRRVVPGWRPLPAYLAAAEAVCPGLRATVPEPPGPEPSVPSAEELLHRYRSLTVQDLPGSGGAAPRGAVEVSTGNGPLYLHPGEAAGSLLLAGRDPSPVRS